MENHVKFSDGKQREFLLRVQRVSNLNVDGLAKIAGVTPRNFRDWKREKLCIRSKVAVDFSLKFGVSLPEEIDEMEMRWRNLKSISGKIGGFACFRKYGSPGTKTGRIKGGRNALKILRMRGVVPEIKVFKRPVVSEPLAELIGILLGDGGITIGQVIITLNSRTDKDYASFVIDLENKILGEKPKFFFKKDCNAISIYLNGINLVKVLKGLGLKVGNKVKQQVEVPLWIKENINFKVACLRGLMDTDGGIFIHKYKINNKLYKYRKICFTNRSLPLLLFTKEVLEELGFTPKIITKVENKKVWLYNSSEVSRYLEIVGSHNTRLLKYKVL